MPKIVVLSLFEKPTKRDNTIDTGIIKTVAKIRYQPQLAK